jgi:hypothetical protein
VVEARSWGRRLLSKGGLTVLTLTIISILVGTALGLRFEVFILVPTIGLTLTVVAVAGIASGDGVWWLVATMVLVATFLQLGYIGGDVLRSVIGAAPATDHRGPSMPSAKAMPQPPEFHLH